MMSTLTLTLINMKIITLYESGSTDGYTDSGSGMFYLLEHEARSHAENKHGCYGRVITHNSVAEIDGEYYLLKRATPIVLANTLEQIKELKELAMSKLTDADKRVLGLIE